MDWDEEEHPWRKLSVLRVLCTLGLVVGVMASLVFIASSRASLLGILLAPPFIMWLCFVMIIPCGSMAAIAVYAVVGIPMALVGDDDVKERVWLGVRWIFLIAGVAAALWIGGRGVYDGMVNNRLATPEVLYERCMEPEERTVEHRWQECSDGWNSPSIGSRGACSWHGGVVWRTIQRKESYQPHDEEFCRKDAAARSWID